MHQKAVLVVLVVAAGLTEGCSSGVSSSEPSAADSSTTVPAATTAAPDPYPVASYPTAQDADTAFVSEVASLSSFKSWLTRTSNFTPSDLAADAARLAQLGRTSCSTYEANHPKPVVAAIQSVVRADPIDAMAFMTDAAEVYCPQTLVEMGQGLAMRDGVRVQPVTPRCPTGAPISVAASKITLSGESNTETYGDFGGDNSLVFGNTDGDYEGTWTYTLTNASDFDAIVTLQERVTSRHYTTDWGPPKDDLSMQRGAFYVPAHQP